MIIIAGYQRDICGLQGAHWQSPAKIGNKRQLDLQQTNTTQHASQTQPSPRFKRSDKKCCKAKAVSSKQDRIGAAPPVPSKLHFLLFLSFFLLPSFPTPPLLCLPVSPLPLRPGWVSACMNNVLAFVMTAGKGGKDAEELQLCSHALTLKMNDSLPACQSSSDWHWADSTAYTPPHSRWRQPG